MSDYEYEQREAQEYQRQLREVEKASLADRKEACKSFFNAMDYTPEVVAERIGWLIDGNYGYGAMQAAKRVLAMRGNANKAASLTHMVAALEWQCPQRMAIAAWKKVPLPAQKRLDRLVKQAITGERDFEVK